MADDSALVDPPLRLRQREHPRLHPPKDPFWPRRIECPPDKPFVPFHLMLLWHWQFFLDDLNTRATP